MFVLTTTFPPTSVCHVYLLQLPPYLPLPLREGSAALLLPSLIEWTCSPSVSTQFFLLATSPAVSSLSFCTPDPKALLLVPFFVSLCAFSCESSYTHVLHLFRYYKAACPHAGTQSSWQTSWLS